MSNDVDARLARIETRLVQLMLFVGADPHGINEHGALLDEIDVIVHGDENDPQPIWKENT